MRKAGLFAPAEKGMRGFIYIKKLASMYKGKYASNRVNSVIFSVILNQRTSSTLQSSALKTTELFAVEVEESRRDKSKPLLGT